MNAPITKIALFKTVAGALLCIWSLHSSATPKIESWFTGNGAKVLFVHAPEIPMIDVKIAFDAGSARDENRPGLAMLTNGMLSEGAAGLSAEQISERIENAGATLSNSIQRDYAWIALRSLIEPSPLNAAIDVLGRLLQQPDFPAHALERSQKLMLIGLQQRQQDPDAVASDAFFAGLYPSHPYSTPTEGNEKSVRAFTRAHLRAFYERFYVAANAVIGIVGDVRRHEAQALAERLVSRLPRGVRAPSLPHAPRKPTTSFIALRHPSSQTHILLGQALMLRPDADFYPLYVGNHALGGGGLVSVLADEIRERRGLSYSVSSHLTGMRAEGPFVAGIQTRNDQAVEAARILKETITSYVKSGPTKTQFDAAVKNISGSFPLHVDSSGKILDYLVSMGFYGLPLDYLDHFVERIEGVTLGQVQDALRRRVHPADFLTVLVGGQGQTSSDKTETAPAPMPHARAFH